MFLIQELMPSIHSNPFCVYYKNIGTDLLCIEKVYEKNIRKHELYHYINILIKKALDFLSKV